MFHSLNNLPAPKKGKYFSEVHEDPVPPPSPSCFTNSVKMTDVELLQFCSASPLLLPCGANAVGRTVPKGGEKSSQTNRKTLTWNSWDAAITKTNPILCFPCPLCCISLSTNLVFRLRFQRHGVSQCPFLLCYEDVSVGRSWYDTYLRTVLLVWVLKYLCIAFT